MMGEPKSGLVSAGAGLAWRRQHLLWWVYAVNLLLGLMATLPFAVAVGGVLDHSLASERLVKGMDLPTLFELAAQPTAPLTSHSSGALFSGTLFFIFMLFVTGGILEVYRRDSKLNPADFFQACGAFFWRFVRLLLFFLIVLAPIAGLAHAISRWSDKLSVEAAGEMTGFWVELAGMAVVVFLLLAVRLWFDMAQVRAVAENERAMRRTLLRAFGLVWHNFGSLFWMYLRISVLAWAGLVLAFWIWVKLVRPESVGVSFLLTQAVVLLWLAARLWQRSSETLWYQQHALAAVPTAAPPPQSVPAPESTPIIETPVAGNGDDAPPK